MSFSQSFEPLFKEDAEVLVLGSMPGVASLQAQEYYAHPRNLFWRFLADIFGESLPISYEEKKYVLIRNRVALWDVLQSCHRSGSLDSSIVASSERANDFPALLAKMPELRGIVFNGKKAEASFRKHVPLVDDYALRLFTVSSTSPANASQGYDVKLASWRHAFETLLTLR